MSCYATIDGRRAADCSFDAVKLGADALLMVDMDGALDGIIHSARLALAAEAVGAMARLVELTVDYGTTRQQFGQSIASFQAVAHRLADMKLAYTKAHAALLFTTALADSGKAMARDFSLLKA